MNGCDYFISVVASDRVGLLRDVTDVVFKLGGNIGLIRQTLVGGFFNLVFIASFSGKVEMQTVHDELDKCLGSDEKSVMVCPAGTTPHSPVECGSRFIVVTEGPDRPGTIYAITSYFGGHGANIEEWNVSQDSSRVIYIAKIIVPDTVDFRALQQGFKSEMSKIGLSAVVCHENIFRATNEIGPIRALLDANAY